MREARQRFEQMHESNLEAGQIRPGQFPTDRFVAFIDIIGFRDFIERMFNDEPELFGILLDHFHVSCIPYSQ